MRALYAFGFVLGTSLVPFDARAETISDALARAYLGNPMLNQQRAATRAADEGVSKAEGAFRPHVNGQGFSGLDSEDVTSGRTSLDLPRSGRTFERDGQVSVRETVFDGNRNVNGLRRADSLDLGSRERLRQTEQETLLAGATAYMDVLRDVALVGLARNLITVLEYELRGARARAKIGEVTFTDVAQVATSLAQGRTRYFQAQSALERSIASYRRVVGVPPARLEAARPVDEIAPSSLAAAVALALTEHPRVAEALHDVDASETFVKLKEGELYPTIDLVGRGEAIAEERGKPENYRNILDVRVRARVPLYTGGKTFAEIRQAKERVASTSLRMASVRDQVRASVMSTWGQLAASKSLIRSSKIAVQASEVALADVRAEATLGQRTTYDVLLAIQAVFRARQTLVAAQRDRVVDSYELAAAAGRLSANNLSLAVTPYDPTIHFAQVKDKWSGLRTPDGR